MVFIYAWELINAFIKISTLNLWVINYIILFVLKRIQLEVQSAYTVFHICDQKVWSAMKFVPLTFCLDCLAQELDYFMQPGPDQP